MYTCYQVEAKGSGTKGAYIMKIKYLKQALQLAQEAGDFEAVEELQLAVTLAREASYQDKWQDHFDNDTADLY